MTSAPSGPRPKITYATLRNDNEEMHALYEAGIEKALTWLGQSHPNLIGGRARSGESEFEKTSPIDGRLVGRFGKGTRQDVKDAVAVARAAFHDWSHTPWQERVAIMRRAADLISERSYEIGALTTIEVGKNRLEALGDVEETADLIRWSCDMVEQNDGFDHPMGNLGDASVHTRSLLRPYGVWAVISPFNFPMALSGGPAGAALVTGNTVVYKPSSDAPLTGVKLAQIFHDAGVPDGAFNLVAGPGQTVGAELQENSGIDGIVFTGSYEVGFNLFKHAALTYPRPVIVEMGGKNPSIVMASADIDRAAEGVMRAAFGLCGQKCSANSRVYVQRPVYDAFLATLVEKTSRITIGNPLDRTTWLGPVINAKSAATFENAAGEARREGRLAIGGERVTANGLDAGFFVSPAIAVDLPVTHRLFREELFVPLTVVAPIDTLDEALTLANENVYGLTAGIYSGEQSEIDTFFDRIQAGVVYANRRAGATTGAWPGVQPFGGWKGSTSTGKAAGGHYYVQQFMHEQSRTQVD